MSVAPFPSTAPVPSVPPATFYVAGGTLAPDAPSYVPRTADAELLAALGRGELCYVLNARQMGKSSLSVRTRQALEAAGTRTAFLDLQKFGSSATAEQWYRALLERIGSDLKLRGDFLGYWRENAEMPPLSRLFGALREVALERVPGNLVVFLDEIDVIRNLGFPTDEFFGAIRETHNTRVTDAAYNRLTFCLIGTVAPTDLIQDVRLSPFNIGTRLKLLDLTRAEAAPLAGPLPGGAKTLDRVYGWTSGHPYLTQRLCAELARENGQDVDAMVARLFLAKSDADVDENIKNVRNGLLRAGSDRHAGFDRTDLLTRYGAIVAGKRVPDDDTDGVCAALRLSGLVTARDGLLRARNRVYAHLFDAAWVRASLPDAEIRRQRAAVARARWQIGSIAAAVLFVMAGLLWRTRQAEQHATAEKRRAVDAAALETAAKNDADMARKKAEAESTRADAAKNQAVTAAANAQAATKQMRAALQGEASAKSDAMTNAGRATRQATRADQATATARSQAERADREASVARSQTAAANHLSYASSIALANQNIANGYYAIAQQFFDDAAKFPRSERGFEWNYLRERFHNELFTLKGHTKGVMYVTYSPNGKRFATASLDHTARLWDTATGRPLVVFKGHTETVNEVVFSPDGRRLLTASDDKTARVWDTATGKTLLVLKGHKEPVTAANFSPDGTRIVTGSLDSTARIWDVASGKTLFTLAGHTASVSWAGYSPDGKRLATTSTDRTARLWDAASGKVQFTLKGHAAGVLWGDFSLDGKRLATASYDSTAKIWDLEAGKELLALKGHRYFVETVAFSPDGKRLATASWDNTAKVWDTSTGEVLLTLNGHRNFVNGVAFSPDGKHLATASSDKTARVWDAESTRASVLLEGHTGVVYQATFSPDGKRLASAGEDNTAKIWDAATGKALLTCKGHGKFVKSVAFSPNSKRVATASGDRTARLWDAGTGKELLILKGHSDVVCSVVFSADGKRVVTASYDKTARVWDAATGNGLLTLTGHKASITSAVFSPDGTRLATASRDGTVRLWDATSGKTLLVFTVHLNTFDKGFASAVTFSPDGKRVATANFDNTASIWDAASGKEILTLNGHLGQVMSVVYSGDGKRLATASNDATARVWDAGTGKELLTLYDYVAGAFSVDFSPDGEQIVTGGNNGIVRIWRKPTQAQWATMTFLRQQRAKAAALANLPLADVNRAAQGLARETPAARPQIALALNNIAWSLVDPTKPRMTDEVARQVLAVATLAVEMSDRKEGLYLDTLAAAQFAVGNLDEALTTEHQAVALLPTNKDLADALKRYESFAATHSKSGKLAP